MNERGEEEEDEEDNEDNEEGGGGRGRNKREGTQSWVRRKGWPWEELGEG